MLFLMVKNWVITGGRIGRIGHGFIVREEGYEQYYENNRRLSTTGPCIFSMTCRKLAFTFCRAGCFGRLRVPAQPFLSSKSSSYPAFPNLVFCQSHGLQYSFLFSVFAAISLTKPLTAQHTRNFFQSNRYHFLLILV